MTDKQRPPQNSPELTVGIPAYNAGRSIGPAIRSVQGQTWRGDMEILVYNDGSTDETAAVVAELAAQDPRIRLVNGLANRGRAFARNQILALAKGCYFAWHDADDEWHPDKLAEQFARLKKAFAELGHENVWCVCSCRINRAEPLADLEFVPALQGDQLKNLLLGELRAYSPTVLGAMESIKKPGEYDTGLSCMEDVDFFTRFLAAGGKIVSTPPDRLLFTYNRDKLEKNCFSVYEAAEYLRQKHRAAHERYGKAFVRREKVHKLLWASTFALQNRRWAVFGRWLAQSLLTSPFWTAYYGGKEFCGFCASLARKALRALKKPAA